MSGTPMTSKHTKRMFALCQSHDTRAGASRDDTRAGVILGKPDATAALIFVRARAWRGIRVEEAAKGGSAGAG
eukprot:4901945-Pleurochrysis_carterae.AAC.1